MRVQSLHQYYLKYRLPRGPGWRGWAVRLQSEDFEAIVKPRSEEEPLFPNEIDQTLSTATIDVMPLSLPGGRLTRTVAESCIDRLLVVIHQELDTLPDDWTEIVDRTTDRAIEAANHFLDHCRVAAKAPDVQRLERHWRPQDQRYYLLEPSTVSWFDADTSERLPVYDGTVNAALSSGALRSPESGSVSIAAVEASFGRSMYPRLAQSLLVDAEWSVMTLGLREAILSIATACEVTSQSYIERKDSSSVEAAKSILRRRRLSFAERHYHLVPQELAGRSLMHENRSDFDQLEALYRERNSLMHSGEFSADLSTLPSRDRQRVVFEWMMGAWRATDWLESI
jgi:hypothetical protein